MRILHVTRYFPPRMGGTERFVASLVRALASRGIESDVVVTNRSRSGPGGEPPVRPIELSVVGPQRFPVVVGGRSRLAAAVRQADIVHIHDLRFAFAVARRLARRYQTPVVLSTHGLIFHTNEHSLVKTLLWRTRYRPALRRLAAVVAVSSVDEDVCRARGLDQNLVRIDNPVDIGPFAGIARRPVPGRLLYFGRLSSNKGIERLAPVLEQDPALSLRIAGHGGPEITASLHGVFDKLGDRVRFVDSPTDAELRDELSQCGCVVLPSRTEAFGMTLVEAMAAGVPIVANDIPTYRTIAAGTETALVDVDEPTAVADALRRVQGADPVQSRARATEFGWEGRVMSYVELYASALSRRTGC